MQSHPFNPTPAVSTAKFDVRGALATFIHQYNAPARCAAMCSLVLRLPPEKNYDFELPLKFREAELHKVPRYRHSQNCANLRRVQKKNEKIRNTKC